MALFNQKRKEAADTGRVWKYLTYALGEIVIVICGILIALQVNNWNDKRKTEAQIEDTFDALEDEIRSNLQLSHTVGQWGLIKDTLCQKVLSGGATVETYQQSPALSGLVLNYFPYFTKREQLRNALSSANTWPEEYRQLLQELRGYVNRMDLTEQTAASVKDCTMDNITYLQNNFTWYARQDPQSIARKHRYFATDSLYFNRVAHYHLLAMMNFVQQVELTSIFEGQLLAHMAQARGVTDPDSLGKMLIADGWEPLERLPCDSVHIPAFGTTITMGALILNTTADTLFVNVNGRPGAPADLPPYEVGVLQAPLGRTLHLSDATGACRGVYPMRLHGLLVCEE